MLPSASAPRGPDPAPRDVEESRLDFAEVECDLLVLDPGQRQTAARPGYMAAVGTGGDRQRDRRVRGVQPARGFRPRWRVSGEGPLQRRRIPREDFADVIGPAERDHVEDVDRAIQLGLRPPRRAGTLRCRVTRGVRSGAGGGAGAGRGIGRGLRGEGPAQTATPAGRPGTKAPRAHTTRPVPLRRCRHAPDSCPERVSASCIRATCGVAAAGPRHRRSPWARAVGHRRHSAGLGRPEKRRAPPSLLRIPLQIAA